MRESISTPAIVYLPVIVSKKEEKIVVRETIPITAHERITGINGAQVFLSSLSCLKNRMAIIKSSISITTIPKIPTNLT